MNEIEQVKAAGIKVPEGPETLDEKRERLTKLQAIWDPERKSEIAEKAFYNLCNIETAHREGREPKNIFPECPEAWALAVRTFARQQTQKSFCIHQKDCPVCQKAAEPAGLCAKGKIFEEKWRNL